MSRAETRRTEHAEDSRRALLAAARKAFAEGGYAATSLEDIVGPARLTKGALYHHFRNKAALFEALYVAMEEELVAHVIATLESAKGDAWARVAIALDAFLEASSEPAYVRIVLRDAPTVLASQQGRALDHAIGLGLVRELVGGLRDQGQLLDLPLDATARVLLAAASEVAVSMACSDEPERARDEGRRVVLAIFEGLRVRRDAPSVVATHERSRVREPEPTPSSKRSRARASRGA